MGLSPQKIEYTVKWINIENKKLEIAFEIKNRLLEYAIGSKCTLNLSDEIFDFCFTISDNSSYLVPFLSEAFYNRVPKKYLEALKSNTTIPSRHNLDDPNDFKEASEELKILTALVTLDNLSIQKELEIDTASKLLNSYFDIFKTDEITKNNWNLFTRMFDLNKQPLSLENYLKDESDTPFLNNGKEKYNSYIEGESIDTYKIRKNKDGFTVYNYLCENSKDIISVVINNVFANKSNAVIKKCELCGNLFLPKKSDTKYCNRKNEQYNNKTCKEVSEALNKKKYDEEDQLLYLRRKVYNKLDRTNEQTPSEKNQIEKDKFWIEDAYITKKYKLNLITATEYEQWLLSFYKKKPKNRGVIS